MKSNHLLGTIKAMVLSAAQLIGLAEDDLKLHWATVPVISMHTTCFQTFCDVFIFCELHVILTN